MILLGSDLMRTDGLRVVSAWNHLPTIRCRPDIRNPYDQFCMELEALVRRDIGAERAHSGIGSFWGYAPYLELYRSLGEQWPVEALAAYLQLFKGSEMNAQSVWAQAVREYGNFKFLNG